VFPAGLRSHGRKPRRKITISGGVPRWTRRDRVVTPAGRWLATPGPWLLGWQATCPKRVSSGCWA